VEVFKGGFKKGSWLHDREAYSDEEIAAVNERFKQLKDRYPQYSSWFEFLLWDIKPKTELEVVK
jgi:hypothetical protein